MSEEDFELGTKEHAEAIQRAVDGRNDLVHMSMIYECCQCKDKRIIHLGVGVEGPAKLREKNLYIASPFGGPHCDKCGGKTFHNYFGSDRYFAPVDPPPGAWYWRVPRKAINLNLFMSSCFCGELIKS